MFNEITQEIINGLHETNRDLLKTISLFEQNQFNIIPFKGSWTAGQVAQHVFKSETGITQLLSSPGKPTSRSPYLNIDEIKLTFLDFTIKMKSPDFILPDENEKSKMELYDGLETNREKIMGIANTADLSKTCDSVPGVGELTGFEWLTFLICHSKRHIWQMQNIYAALTR